jgi:late competence protein required for DNA uptake (superfamily II DNA/RNA helicase)
MTEEKKEEKIEEAGKKASTTKEKPANCASCNKSIKKKQWYYRNGKYYCSKRCWKTASKKEKKPEAPQEPKP